jgi:hypothetical protein
MGDLDSARLPSRSAFLWGRDTFRSCTVSHMASIANKAIAVAALGQTATTSMRSQPHRIA